MSDLTSVHKDIPNEATKAAEILPEGAVGESTQFDVDEDTWQPTGSAINPIRDAIESEARDTLDEPKQDANKES
jgi:hypothetical protein